MTSDLTARAWAVLKRCLIASLGREGASEWLLFAAATLRAEAKRERMDCPITVEFRP